VDAVWIGLSLVACVIPVDESLAHIAPTPANPTVPFVKSYPENNYR
jgi:hypothetical protein